MSKKITTEAAEACLPLRWPMGVMIALVLLRLAVGWHYFSEGTKKITYNKVTGEAEISVPSEQVFGGAVGPFAGFFKSRLPGFHNWEELLAVPNQAVPATEEERAKADRWQAVYERDRKAANGKGEIPQAEFPPTAPYTAWAEQIVEDWRGHLADVVAIKGLTEEQQAEAADILQRRHLQLADFLQSESAAIADWQHELWRLQQAEEHRGANEIPFEEQRIAQQRADTTSTARRFVSEVQGIQRGLFNDWRVLIPTQEDGEDAGLTNEIDSTLENSKARSLRYMNTAVTCLIIGVGVLMMLGLFTRVAAVGGIIFLLMVMATQPPWVPEASKMFFYYQLVELAAFVVLFTTAAGRFAGLDYFLCRCCGGKKIID